MAFRFCKFSQLAVMTNGKKKVRCKLDGSIRNECSYSCPHLRPTIMTKIWIWRWNKKYAARYKD